MATNQVIHGSNRVVENPNRYKLNAVSGQANTYDLEKVPGTITDNGTPYNKIILDKIDNVLSYLTPSVEKEMIETPFIETGITATSITPTWSSSSTTAKTENVVMGLKAYARVLPTLTISNTLNYWYAYNSGTSTRQIYYYSYDNVQYKYTSTDFMNNLNRGAKGNYYNVIGFYSTYSNSVYIDYDLGIPCKCKFNTYINNQNGKTIKLQASNNMTTWTDISNIVYNQDCEIVSNEYYRYYRVELSNNTTSSTATEYYIYYMRFSEIQYNIVTYINNFTLDNNGTAFTNNQRVLIETGEPFKIIDDDINFENNIDTQISCRSRLPRVEYIDGKYYAIYYDNSSTKISLFNESKELISTAIVENDFYYDGDFVELNNGNIGIIYTTSLSSTVSMKYMVISKNGDIIIQPILLDNTEPYRFSDSSKLAYKTDDGNIIIGFTDYTSSTTINNAYGMVISENGNIIKGKRSIYTFSRSTSLSYFKKYTDGTFGLITPAEMEYIHFNNDLTILNHVKFKSGTSYSYYGFAIIELENYNLSILYSTANGTDAVKTYNMIIDKNGNIIKNESFFDDITLRQVDYKIFNNHNILLIYGDNYTKICKYTLLSPNFDDTLIEKTILNNTDQMLSYALKNDSLFYKDITSDTIQYYQFIYIPKHSIGEIDMTGVISNTLNGIEVQSLLQPSAKYELVYNENEDKFKLGCTLFDITLTEAVNQIDLTGISNNLEVGKIYSLDISGTLDNSSNIKFGYADMMYGTTSYIYAPLIFNVYIRNGNKTISGIKTISSVSWQGSSITGSEYIKCTTASVKFNEGTRIIIKEVA